MHRSSSPPWPFCHGFPFDLLDSLHALFGPHRPRSAAPQSEVSLAPLDHLIVADSLVGHLELVDNVAAMEIPMVESNSDVMQLVHDDEQSKFATLSFKQSFSDRFENSMIQFEAQTFQQYTN